MNIQVRVHDVLKDRIGQKYHSQAGEFKLSMPDNSTARDLIAKLGLSDDWVGLIIVNGLQATPDRQLERNDIIDLISPMAGG